MGWLHRTWQKTRAKIMHSIGAVLYGLWGLLHLFAAFQVLNLGSGLEPGMVQGRIYQDGWTLLYFSIFVLAIAVFYNWKNRSLGYWLNLVTASITDIGFIVFILVPGHLPLIPGLFGPALWISAVVFSTLGILSSSTPT
jgi:hypothetical protein